MFNRKNTTFLIIVLVIGILMVGAVFSQPLTGTVNHENSQNKVIGTNSIQVLFNLVNGNVNSDILDFYDDTVLKGSLKSNLDGFALKETYFQHLNQETPRIIGENNGYTTTTADKEIPNIVAKNLSCKFGDSVIINVNLTKANGMPLADKPLHICFDNGTPITTIKTNNKGIINYNFTPQYLKSKFIPKKYSLKAIFTGDNDYGYKQSVFYLDVKKLDCFMFIDNASTYLNEKCTITATLDNKDAPDYAHFHGQPVFFYYPNGTLIGYSYTGFNGIAQYTFICNEPGNFKITGKSLGNDHFKPSNATAYLNVYKYRYKIIMYPVMIGSPGEKFQTSARLSQIAGDPIPGKRISFIMEDRWLGDNITNRNGVATMEGKAPEKEGDYTITSAFMGEDGVAINASQKLIVKRFYVDWFVYRV